MATVQRLRDSFQRAAACQPKWARNKRLLKRCLRGSLLNCRINAVKSGTHRSWQWNHVTSFVVSGQRAAVNVSVNVLESEPAEGTCRWRRHSCQNGCTGTKCGARNTVRAGRKRESKNHQTRPLRGVGVLVNHKTHIP